MYEPFFLAFYIFSSTGFYFNRNVIKGSHKEKNMFLIFGHIFEVLIFFSRLVVIQSTQFFSSNKYL